MENIIIVVMGGSAINLVPIIVNSGYNLIGYTDDYGDKNVPDLELRTQDGLINNVEIKYLGTNDKLIEIKEKYNCNNAVIGVGGVGKKSSIELKQKLSSMLKEQGFNLPSIISESAYINPYDVKIGEGTFIMPGVIVQSGARIGNYCLLNTGSQIDHECNLEDFVHVAPGAILCGRINVREGAHIGAGSVVKEAIEIGEYSIIGAGAVVIKDIEAGKTYVGNPARELKR
jgi:sugar O-acyltransferase (sialic acid O-acetyltransferase NeuD family)